MANVFIHLFNFSDKELKIIFKKQKYGSGLPCYNHLKERSYLNMELDSVPLAFKKNVFVLQWISSFLALHTKEHYDFEFFLQDTEKHIKENKACFPKAGLLGTFEHTVF